MKWNGSSRLSNERDVNEPVMLLLLWNVRRTNKDITSKARGRRAVVAGVSFRDQRDRGASDTRSMLSRMRPSRACQQRLQDAAQSVSGRDVSHRLSTLMTH